MKSYVVKLWGESQKEVEKYLKYNAEGISLTLLEETKKDGDDFWYRFHVVGNEESYNKLNSLRDVEVVG